MDLKILDINLWLLPPPFSAENKQRMMRFVELAKRLDPDVITLQEVWLIKYAAYLKKNLSEYYSFYSHTKKFNKSGLMTLSKEKPISHYHKYFKVYRKEGLIERSAKKGYLVIKLKIGGTTFNLLNTHLCAAYRRLVNKITLQEFKLLKSTTRKGEWIIVGDLNIPQQIFIDLNKGYFRYKSVKYPTVDSTNRYARMRLNKFAKYPKKLDYILLRTDLKQKFSIRTRVIRSPPLSDHYGLLSHIKLPHENVNKQRDVRHR